MSWTVLDEEQGILAFEYEFRPGAYATTLVFRGLDGLVAVSPGSGMVDADFEGLVAYGTVVALVANNAGHHLGQADWRARFPDAESYAASSITAQLQKKSGIPYRDVRELELGDTATVHLVDGFKQGELLVTAGAAGSVWYTGDLLTNMQRLPGIPLRWLFTGSGSAPGFKVFRLGIWFFVSDKAALREHMQRLVEAHPPTAVVPGHGPPLVEGDVAAAVRTQVARI